MYWGTYMEKKWMVDEEVDGDTHKEEGQGVKKGNTRFDYVTFLTNMMP